MHIIQVTPRFPPAIGGVENHVYNISIELAKRGHDVTVVTSSINSKRNCNCNKEFIDGITVYRCPLFFQRIFREVWLMPDIKKILHNLEADIIHAHGYRCLSSCIALFSAKRKGIPFVLTPHGIFPKRNLVNGLMKFAYDYTLGNMLLNESDKIIALTKSNKSLILQMGCSENKVVIIENGVDIAKYKKVRNSNVIKKKYGFLGPVLLYVGRIAWHKNLERVIEALPLIKNEFFNVKFLIVGPDTEKNSAYLLRLAKKLRVEDCVIIKGAVSVSELPIYYSIADIFILPSFYEGLSLSMLEAMASKVPVVVRSSAGVGDILRDNVNALILRSGSTTEISNAIISLLSSSRLKQKIRKNAYNLILRKYTWKVVVDKLELLYKELAKS